MTLWGQLSFQDASSLIMQDLISFHDHAMTILILVISMVSYAFFSLVNNSFSSRFTLEAQEIETIWTVLPAIMLLFLALPSLRILYLMDETGNPCFLSTKAIGHQWYWTYEFTIFNKYDLTFDSYMIPQSDLTPGDYRLLEVDNRACLPTQTEIRLFVTSADVIHAWTIPSLGVKVDAIPGRINQIPIYASRPGVFYGQCSEICGANHSFMPIVIQFVSFEGFLEWFWNIIHLMES
uniref:cytochrome c oxidase subunit II n=1 Tax=Glyphohesione klatti TaxID=3053539 RepID=UPI0030E4A889